MTDAPLGLGSVISAERARASQQSMRACLREVATRGTTVWTAGLVQVLPVLVEVARIHLCLARLVEGHADGLRTIDQANGRPHDGMYAVWASRPAGTGIKAADFDGGWRLDGELRFASGVGLVDRALVPVWHDREHHLLLDLPADIGEPDLDSWKTCAMDAARSFDLRVDSEAPASSQLGPANFYLQRPGFVLGGLCVAAVWVGGARHVVDVETTSVRPFSLTRHQQRRIGVMEQAAWQAQTVLEAVAGRIATSPSPARRSSARPVVWSDPPASATTCASPGWCTISPSTSGSTSSTPSSSVSASTPWQTARGQPDETAPGRVSVSQL